MLAHQGLWPPYELHGKAGILDYIRRVGCIQFDPLNIVGHNQELVLQARIADFQPVMLRELLYQDRKLLDGWDKNMSIYSVEDWPYFRRRREHARQHPRRSGEQVNAVLPQLRQAITERGPVSSIDLDMNQIVDWWWAPTTLARAALESMYLWGELIIHHKVHTRRVYDFAHRHLPAELLDAPEPNETEDQYHDWYVYRRIGSLGLLWDKAGEAWLGVDGVKSAGRKAAFARLLKQGKITEVKVEGINVPCYLRNEDLASVNTIIDSDGHDHRAAILAPLDNLLWDRQLTKTLFDFDYRWEVYKPVSERQYGYYVLPVLYGDRFVARFDSKYEKKSKTLVIKNWWWEHGVTRSEEMAAELQQCFQRFQRFLGAQAIQVDRKLVKQVGLKWLPIHP